MSEREVQNETQQQKPVEVKSGEEFLKAYSVLENFGRQAKTMIFSTEQEATEACTLYVNRGVEELSKIEGIKTLDLVISGDGVSVPNVKIQPLGQDDGGTEGGNMGAMGVATYLDPEMPIRKLDITEELPARFDNIYGKVHGHEAGMYGVSFSMSVYVGGSRGIVMNVPGYPDDFATVSTYHKAVVALDGTSSVSVEAIEKYREREAREAYVRRYEHSPITTGAFGVYLRRINQALSKEEREFTHLNNVRLIRALGRIGAERAESGEAASDIISRTLLYRLGPMRSLRVAYDEVIDETPTKGFVSGNLLEVIMPQAPGDGIAPAMAIEGIKSFELNPNDIEQGIHIVPMTRVRAFEF